MRRKVCIRRTRVLIPCFLFFLFLSVGAAEGQNVACFDWSCDPSTGFCNFDASCTQNQGNLWRYRWDFGDGGPGYTFTGSATISHQYGGPCIYPHVVLTVIDYNVASFSTGCDIVQRNCVGPPLSPAGRCSG